MQGSFFTITENGTADDVYFLYGQGANIKEIHDYGKLPIGAAAAAGNMEVVRALVELGADPDEDDYEGYTPIEYALWGEHYETVFALLQIGDDAVRRKRTMFALFKAASTGDDFLVNALLDRGADVNGQDEYGSTALIHAAERQPHEGRLAVLRTLIGRGADVHLRGQNAETALQLASRHWMGPEAREEALKAVQLLVEAGAQIGLVEAVALNDVVLTRQLLEAGANANDCDRYGSTLLQNAASQNCIENVRLLLEHGANAFATDKYGADVLLYVVSDDYASIIALLLEQGLNLNRAQGSDGKTALIEAAEQNASNFMPMLIEAGADVNAANRFGYTALMIAAERNALDAARVLLNAAADVHRENIHCRTALAYAVNLGHEEFADLLRAHGARLITE